MIISYRETLRAKNKRKLAVDVKEGVLRIEYTSNDLDVKAYMV
jgi:hypothetical protein